MQPCSRPVSTGDTQDGYSYVWGWGVWGVGCGEGSAPGIYGLEPGILLSTLQGTEHPPPQPVTMPRLRNPAPGQRLSPWVPQHVLSAVDFYKPQSPCTVAISVR